jgi:hypothetical protein
MSATTVRRRPDFFVSGAMKAGTTSLYAWLRSHPEIWLPEAKEINHFGRPGALADLSRYAAHFSAAPADARTGDCSIYAAPGRAELAAAQIAQVCPGAPAIFIVRDRADRMRSHYRHQVQRGRERRPFAVATRDVDSDYVRHSCYADCVEPFARHLGRSLHVEHFDAIFSPPHEGWHRILEVLQVTDSPPALTHRNRSAGKAAFTRGARLLWELGLLQHARRVPAPLRRLLRPLALHQSASYHRLTESSSAALPSEIQQRLEDDELALRRLLADGARRAL